MRTEQTNQQLLEQYDSCVGTPDNVSCYSISGRTHDNWDTVLLIGGFVAFIVVAVILYRLKFGGNK